MLLGNFQFPNFLQSNVTHFPQYLEWIDIWLRLISLELHWHPHNRDTSVLATPCAINHRGVPKVVAPREGHLASRHLETILSPWRDLFLLYSLQFSTFHISPLALLRFILFFFSFFLNLLCLQFPTSAPPPQKKKEQFSWGFSNLFLEAVYPSQLLIYRYLINSRILWKYLAEKLNLKQAQVHESN